MVHVFVFVCIVGMLGAVLPAPAQTYRVNGILVGARADRQILLRV
jgi:hypothetical protein